MKRIIALLVLLAVGSSLRAQQQPSREDWGAVPVTVSRDGADWIITGKKNVVTLDASDHTIRIDAGQAHWKTLPPTGRELVVKRGGQTFTLDLRDARKIAVDPYDTGYGNGVKLTLSDWEKAPDLKLFMTLSLEGKDEDFVFGIASVEGETRIDRLDWPTAMDAKDVDYTLLPRVRGILLPHDWPKRVDPIRELNDDGTQKYPKEPTEPQSNIVEDWSMSWWGFVKGKSAMMVIIETPDDAAYQFDHPAGGPTVIGPRWRESLGQLRYPRSGRMCFFPDGNYVTLAKRYRKYAMDSGLFVSLNEKIARKPIVKELIGTPMTRMGILTNIKSDSLRYKKDDPSFNHHVTSFDDRASQLRKLKESGMTT